MKGTVKRIKDLVTKEKKLALLLVAESDLEKKWLLNAFYCISPGVLNSSKGNIESLVLWTDNNRKLPRKHKSSIVTEKKEVEKQ